MKMILSVIVWVCLQPQLFAQGVVQKVEVAMEKLSNDSQSKHAIISLYVVNSKTGAVVYDKNSQVGLAAASSQKVITSAAALELLGIDFRYETTLSKVGKIDNGVLKGNLIISGRGDPSLGSWRYSNTKEDIVLNNWTKAVQQAGIKTIEGKIVIDDGSWESQTIPGGWTWDDIGNYYGAGVAGVNWRENQYDLKLKPGNKVGAPATVITTTPKLYEVSFESELTTGPKGSGDHTIIYLPPQSTSAIVRGTIPLGENPFVVSGSIPSPALQLSGTLKSALQAKGIRVLSNVIKYPKPSDPKLLPDFVVSTLYTHSSPPLDSINHYFLRRSVNLYGEALVKTIGYEGTDFGSTDSGLAVIKRFWNERGIEPSAIRMIDGSGLSPQNRVTTNALVTVMQYARTRPWYNSFYDAIALVNNLKMKSGTIGGAKSYTGYVNSRDGQEYTFAIVINNYSGSTSSIERKLWAVLDSLK